MPKTIAKKFLSQLDPYRHIIWDWNGTILDDVEIALDSVGEILDEHGLRRPSVHEYRDVFGFPIVDYYERLGLTKVSASFQDLSNRFHDIYSNKAKEAGIFKGMVETLSAIGESKTQSILSAASQWHLEEIVARFGLHVHFTHICGLSDNLANSKVERGKELMREAGVDANLTILIGDTDHDLEVAKELGIDALLVADGHQSFERLNEIHHNVMESRFH